MKTIFNIPHWNEAKSTQARRRRQYQRCRGTSVESSLGYDQGLIWVIRFKQREHALSFALRLINMHRTVYVPHHAEHEQRPHDVTVREIMSPNSARLAHYRNLLLTDISDFDGQVIVDGVTFDWADPDVLASEGITCFVATRSIETCTAMAQRVFETGGAASILRRNSRFWPWYIAVHDFKLITGATPKKATVIMQRFCEEFSAKFMFTVWAAGYSIDEINRQGP